MSSDSDRKATSTDCAWYFAVLLQKLAVLTALKPLQLKRAHSISSQEQLKHQNAENTQEHQHVPYFTNVSRNVTNYHPATAVADAFLTIASLSHFFRASL